MANTVVSWCNSSLLDVQGDECSEVFRGQAEEEMSPQCGRKPEDNRLSFKHYRVNNHITIDPRLGLERTVFKLVAPKSFEEQESLRKIRYFVISILGPRPQNELRARQWDQNCMVLLECDQGK